MLKYTTNRIVAEAYKEPLINTIVRGDIFRINTKPECRYGVFSFIQQPHTSTPDFWTFNYIFYYVDRLTADKRNELDIHNSGINFLGRLCDHLDIQNVTYTTFLQKFNDECAGVYCQARLLVPRDYDCKGDEDLYDFSNDFNNDFLIKGINN